MAAKAADNKEVRIMGIALSGPDISTDLPPSGFFRLRRDLAYLISKKAGDLYDKMIEINLSGTEQQKKTWVEAMNHELDTYIAVHGKRYEKVCDFLFMSDCDGRISYATCKRIVGLINSTDIIRRDVFMDTVYGYAGWGDKACKGKDVYEILKNCADAKKPLIWY